MDRAQFHAGMDALYDRIKEMNRRKGKDYAGDEDVLSNFKKHAAELSLRPEQIWAVYASKHWDAIMAYCREGQVESEPIDGRILDAILYLFLLDGMVVESDDALAEQIAHPQEVSIQADIRKRLHNTLVVALDADDREPHIRRALQIVDGEVS